MPNRSPSSANTTSRRRLLKSVTAGVLGCSLPTLLAAESQARSARTSGARARNVLVIYEEGGISQMDSWDPKPDALLDHRSPFAPAATSPDYSRKQE